MPGKPVATTPSQTQSTPNPNSPSNPGSSFDIAKSPTNPSALGVTTPPPAVVTPTYLSLTINQDPAGSVKEEASATLKTMAKDSGAALVNVAASWTVADSSIGTLSGTPGTEVTFTAKKAGKTKVTASFQSLKATTTITVISKDPVLGATTAPPAKPAVTPVEIRLYDGNSTGDPNNQNGTSFKVGDSRSFSAKVFYSDGTLRSVDVNWSVDPSDLGSLNRTKGSSVDFKASRNGSGNLKATLDNLSTSLYIQVN